MKLLLRNIINDAIFKDVYKRYKIKDKDSFEKTFKYIFDTIGNEISLNNISKLLKVNYRTTKQQIK
jgi:predicted AAA+ superfamily ATPase